MIAWGQTRSFCPGKAGNACHMLIFKRSEMFDLVEELLNSIMFCSDLR